MTQERDKAVTGREAVFEFKTELTRSEAAEPEEGPKLRLHLERNATATAPLSRLSWTAVDGAHSAISFQGEMAGFLGLHRAADGALVQLRGSLENRRSYPSLPPGIGAADVQEFLTHQQEAESGVWRSAGRLQVLLDDGRGCALRDLEWHDEDGNSGAISIDRTTASFLGYYQVAGQAALGYRGFAVVKRNVPNGDDLRAELEAFGRVALDVVQDLLGKVGGLLGGGGGEPPRPA